MPDLAAFKTSKAGTFQSSVGSEFRAAGPDARTFAKLCSSLCYDLIKCQHPILVRSLLSASAL